MLWYVCRVNCLIESHMWSVLSFVHVPRGVSTFVNRCFVKWVSSLDKHIITVLLYISISICIGYIMVVLFYQYNSLTLTLFQTPVPKGCWRIFSKC